MNLYRHTFNTVYGDQLSLADFKDKVVLVVNTASQCGFTRQYADLEQLYLKYRDYGFVILAFPSNDYGSQEPGTNEEIAEFCKTSFNISFPVLEKISVLNNAFYADINSLVNQSPKWNFHKYLIGKHGTEIKSFMSDSEVETIVKDLEVLLGITNSK